MCAYQRLLRARGLVPCRFFAQGRCRDGARCAYLHLGAAGAARQTLRGKSEHNIMATWSAWFSHLNACLALGVGAAAAQAAGPGDASARGRVSEEDAGQDRVLLGIRGIRDDEEENKAMSAVAPAQGAQGRLDPALEGSIDELDVGGGDLSNLLQRLAEFEKELAHTQLPHSACAEDNGGACVQGSREGVREGKGGRAEARAEGEARAEVGLEQLRKRMKHTAVNPPAGVGVGPGGHVGAGGQGGQGGKWGHGGQSASGVGGATLVVQHQLRLRSAYLAPVVSLARLRASARALSRSPGLSLSLSPGLSVSLARARTKRARALSLARGLALGLSRSLARSLSPSLSLSLALSVSLRLFHTTCALTHVVRVVSASVSRRRAMHAVRL